MSRGRSQAKSEVKVYVVVRSIGRRRGDVDGGGGGGGGGGLNMEPIVVKEMMRGGLRLKMKLRVRVEGVGVVVASGGSLTLVSILVAAEGLGGVELARAELALEGACGGRRRRPTSSSSGCLTRQSRH